MAKGGWTVSLLGLGRMGTALGEAFLASDHTLTVWNRTSPRCRPLAEAGASVADTVEAAAAASDVVVVCVRDYSASDDLLLASDVTGIAGMTPLPLDHGLGHAGAEAPLASFLIARRALARAVGGVRRSIAIVPPDPGALRAGRP